MSISSWRLLKYTDLTTKVAKEGNVLCTVDVERRLFLIYHEEKVIQRLDLRSEASAKCNGQQIHIAVPAKARQREVRFRFRAASTSDCAAIRAVLKQFIRVADSQTSSQSQLVANSQNRNLRPAQFSEDTFSQSFLSAVVPPSSQPVNNSLRAQSTLSSQDLFSQNTLSSSALFSQAIDSDPNDSCWSTPSKDYNCFPETTMQLNYSQQKSDAIRSLADLPMKEQKPTVVPTTEFVYSHQKSAAIRSLAGMPIREPTAVPKPELVDAATMTEPIGSISDISPAILRDIMEQLMQQDNFRSLQQKMEQAFTSGDFDSQTPVNSFAGLGCHTPSDVNESSGLLDVLKQYD